jgi:redox-sensitive bicupin YhaK (pirin superfamily)
VCNYRSNYLNVDIKLFQPCAVSIAPYLPNGFIDASMCKFWRLNMLQVRPAAERGQADHGWLKSQHTFSFADYVSPTFMGWGNLRVINEDRVASGMGFGTHGHRDMEIMSYVISGELAHKDDMGNGTSIPPGDVQRLSAGTGIRHSEFNHAQDSETHFLQIWLLPHTVGIAPGYEQKHFSVDDKRGILRLVADKDGQDGAVTIHSDARMYAGLFDGAESAAVALDPTRKAYVQVVKGSITVSGHALAQGDGLLVADESSLSFDTGDGAEVLLFDLAA